MMAMCALGAPATAVWRGTSTCSRLRWSLVLLACFFKILARTNAWGGRVQGDVSIVEWDSCATLEESAERDARDVILYRRWMPYFSLVAVCFQCFTVVWASHQCPTVGLVLSWSYVTLAALLALVMHSHVLFVDMSCRCPNFKHGVSSTYLRAIVALPGTPASLGRQLRNFALSQPTVAGAYRVSTASPRIWHLSIRLRASQVESVIPKKGLIRLRVWFDNDGQGYKSTHVEKHVDIPSETPLDRLGEELHQISLDIRCKDKDGLLRVPSSEIRNIIILERDLFSGLWDGHNLETSVDPTLLSFIHSFFFFFNGSSNPQGKWGLGMT
jgi:hypothetical protein